MKRLTKKVNYKDNYMNEHFPQYDVNTQDNCDIKTRLTQITNKLGQYEDIEEKYCIRSNEDLCRRLELSDKYGELTEQLGIDLVTFFKYLSAKEVFFINDFNEIKRAVVRSIDKKGLIVFEEAFYWGECDFTLYFKDYGKTWALTKKELR